MDVLYLCGVAFLAGLIDSIAGGGGLLQLPALFLILPEIGASQAAALLGTNKLSSICGTAAAAWQYSRRVRFDGTLLPPATAAALMFSFLGARTVSLIQPELFKPLVLVLLVAAAIYTSARKSLGSVHAPRLNGRSARIAAAICGAAVGFYDGFFGPGTGSILLVVFVGVFGFDFLNASAAAKVINLATNIAALAYFAPSGLVLYGYAIPMGVCNVLGAVVGIRLAFLKGNRFIRALFLAVIAVTIARFGWEIIR